MTARLAALYLRSRRAGHALAAVAIVALLAWLGLDLSDDRGLVTIVLLAMPLGAAVAVATSTRSPFGETERAAGFPLPALRAGHLGVLLAVAALLLAAANTATPTDATAWNLVRNGAGYAGVGLVAARVLGAGIAWMPPVGYGMAVLVARASGGDSDVPWMWPIRSTAVDSAWWIALALLALGLLLAVRGGARDEPGEAA